MISLRLFKEIICNRYVQVNCFVTLRVICDKPVIAIGLHDLHSHISSTIRRVIIAPMSCLLMAFIQTLLFFICLYSLFITNVLMRCVCSLFPVEVSSNDGCGVIFHLCQDTAGWWDFCYVHGRMVVHEKEVHSGSEEMQGAFRKMAS